MGIALVIINAIAALSGPFTEALRSFLSMIHDWESKSGVTHDQLTNDALGAAKGFLDLGSDVETAIGQVSAQLKADHPSIDPAHAHGVAALAVSQAGKSS